MSEWQLLARAEHGFAVLRCPEGHIHVEVASGLPRCGSQKKSSLCLHTPSCKDWVLFQRRDCFDHFNHSPLSAFRATERRPSYGHRDRSTKRPSRRD